jgi:Papain family cysteine protease
MSKQIYSGEFEAHFSAFKGHELEKLGNIPARVTKKLAELGIEDAEQLVALSAVDGTGYSLADELQISQDDFGELLQRAQAALPPHVASAISAPQEPNLNLGALEPTAEIRAEMEAAMLAMPQGLAEAISLPSSVNYAQQMSAIRNQGARGTCVAHAMTAVHEFYDRQAGNPNDYSEQFLYQETKQIDGAPSACGTWQVKAAQVLGSLGQCRESVWPYNPNLPCNNNGTEPSNARSDAAPHKLATLILNPKDVNAIKSALAGGSVVGFSIPVWNSWYASAETRRSGRITMKIGGEASVGGHAMCLIGYQDDAGSPGGGFFILRNSWSTGWGYECPYGAGNGTIPYQYLANENWEAVTTAPPPKPRPQPDPNWWRKWPWFFKEGSQDTDTDTSKEQRTLVIDTGGKYNIIIR